MKNHCTKFNKRSAATWLATALLTLFMTMNIKAQTVSDFENLVIPADTFWNGSDMSGGFTSGHAFFPTIYDSTYDYWAAGWAYSNKKDSTTAGFGNMYSARAAAGALNSEIYAVGQQGAVIRLTDSAAGRIVSGVWITNATYPALSMRDGDAFSKKFGGLSGNDPDWFKLTVSGWYGGTALNDTVEFYLADYRFADNNMDYIVTDWRYIDLTTLGNTDSLVFALSSSDTGSFGMNTPAFFCLDNLTTADSHASIKETDKGKIRCFPNPATDFISLEAPGIKHLRVLNATGQCVLNEEKPSQELTIDIRNFAKGLYLIEIATEYRMITMIFLKP